MDESAIPARAAKGTGLAERLRGRVIANGDGKVSDASLPNIITVVRILLAPVFVWLLFLDGGHGGAIRWVAGILFIVAIATDGIDGRIARGRNLITNVGILLDPIADKVLTGAALVSLSILGELPYWVTAVILVREIGITIYRYAVLSTRVIPASRGGKLKTVVQSVAISAALLPFPHLLGEWVNVVNTVLMAAALVLTVVSGADYLWQAYRKNRA